MPHCRNLRTGISVLVFLLIGSFISLVSAQEPADEPEIRAQMATAENLLGKTQDRGAVLYFLASLHAQLQEPN